MNAQTPSLLGLGYDILAIIIDLLADTSPHTLLSVSLANSKLHDVARYAQYKHITLDIYDTPEKVNRHLLHIKQHGLLSSIRSLHVKYSGFEDLHKVEAQPFGRQADVELYTTYRKERDNIILICNALLELPGLRELRWNTAFLPFPGTAESRRTPSRISLDSMVSASRIDVHFDIASRSIQYLIASTNLTKLHVFARYTDARQARRIIWPLKDVLTSCPSLRSLTLDIKLVENGGPITNAALSKYAGCGFVNGEKPLALEELAVIAYPFGMPAPHPEEAHPYRLHSYVDYPGDEHEVDYWVKHLDWFRIRKLHLSSMDMMLKVVPKVEALTDIVVDAACSLQGQVKARNAWTLLSDLPTSLESIAIPSLKVGGVFAIARHGDSLKRLKIHTTEIKAMGNLKDRTPITMDNLRLIALYCPIIEELSVDVDRHGKWPWDVLHALSQLPRLGRLELWFALGTKTGDSVTALSPYLTSSAAEAIFRHLRIATLDKFSLIRELKIHAGEPECEETDRLDSYTKWLVDQSISFRCSPPDSEDEVKEGKVFVHIANDYNKEKRQPEGMETACSDLAREVARNTFKQNKKLIAQAGPQPYCKWAGIAN